MFDRRRSRPSPSKEHESFSPWRQKRSQGSGTKQTAVEQEVCRLHGRLLRPGKYQGCGGSDNQREDADKCVGGSKRCGRGRRSGDLPGPHPARQNQGNHRLIASIPKLLVVLGVPKGAAGAQKQETPKEARRSSMGTCCPLRGGGQRTCSPAGPRADLSCHSRGRGAGSPHDDLQGNSHILPQGKAKTAGTAS